MARLMVRHRDAADLERCPRLYARGSARDRGASLPSPGLELWRTVVDGLQAAYAAGSADSFSGLMGHVVPPGGVWAGPEQRAEVQSLIESYLELADGLGGSWTEPPETSVQLASKSGPVVLDGRLWLTFDHGSDEVEVRKVELNSFHLPPDAEALKTEFSTAVLALLLHRWRPRPHVRVTLAALRAHTAVTCQWDESELGLARAIVKEWVAERMQRVRFEPNPHPLCPSCVHLRTCPSIPVVRGQESGLRAAITGRPSPVEVASAVNDPWTVFSPSRRRLFEQCPRRYRNRHVLGLSGDAGLEGTAAVGLAVHRALADVHAGGASGHAGLASACRRAAAEVEADPAEVSARAYAHIDLCPGDGYLGGEVDLFAVLDDVVVHGRADALWASPDGGIEVRDYKTGTHSTEDETTTATYAVLAAAAHPDRRPVRVSFEDLSQGGVVTRTYDEVELDDAITLVRAAAGEMAAATEFPARPGPLCASCPYRAACPAALED